MTERDLSRFDQMAMKGFALLVAIALFARLLALPAMAHSHPGSVPICGAGKITWTLIEGGTTKAPDQTADPCPYFGLPIAPASPLPAMSPPEAAWFIMSPTMRIAQLRTPAAVLTPRTRAPPRGL